MRAAIEVEQGGLPPNVAALALGALGVVYGDIGTSPLYALKTAFSWAGHDTPAKPRRRVWRPDRDIGRPVLALFLSFSSSR